MCLIRAVVLFISLISLILVYRGRCDDGDRILLAEYDSLLWDESRWEQDYLFNASGICAAENLSFVKTCKQKNSKEREAAKNLFQLRNIHCFCDDECHKYHDCCIDYGFSEYVDNNPWKCRDVRPIGNIRIPIYVFQKCPDEWIDPYTRTMCEIEATSLEKDGKEFSYLQDIPVKSKVTGRFYRNAFCALCNSDTNVIKWRSYYDCVNVPEDVYGKKLEDFIDFSNSIYKPRTMYFQNVKIGEIFTNCNIAVENFGLHDILHGYGGKLCKPVIDTCDPNSNETVKRRCKSFTSFVYQHDAEAGRRKVYKNFHCALCNNANIGKLRCIDPLYPPVYSDPRLLDSSLAFLFDFNFDGGQNQLGFISPCKLHEGKIWDPVHKKCSEFTCGVLFERKGSKCVPRVTDDVKSGLHDSCPKLILHKGMFKILYNGSVFVNSSQKYLSSNEYEVHDRDRKEIIKIAICADEGSFLLSLSRAQYWLSEITLSLSIICLILHLCVYTILKDLRNSPGKILMSLSGCLLCGHIFLLIGPHVKHIYGLCYLCGVLMHFGYLSSFLWMNIMAYDIYRTFSETHCRNTAKNKTFLRYSLYCWITSSVITTFSVCFDIIISDENEFRPKYGYPICWFNQRKGLLIFFILPIFTILIENAILFTVAAFRIRTISKQTKMVNNFSDKVRYYLYIKLSVVFGLTWLLGVIAGILRVGFLWYPFIILNGLQGVFIFIAFTIKRKIIKMLLIKFKIRSDSYKMGKQSGFKRAMYSSLSNLSTLQTTLTAHLPALEENPEILKAVRRINPDIVMEAK